MKIFVLHLHSQVSVRHQLYNQVDQMTCSVNLSQPSSSATDGWYDGLISGVATVSERKICVDPTAWTSTYQGWSSYCCFWMSQLLTKESNSSWHYSSRKPIDHLTASWLHWPASTLKRSVIPSHRDKYLCWYEFALPTSKTSASITV